MAAASLGFSPDRLQRIERFLQDRYVGPGRIPCAQLQVMRRGELAYEAVLGQADVERGRKLEADAIFRIYSMTKPITSIALMMLVEEGAIALDDPVHKYIPAWKDLAVFKAGLPGQFMTAPVERPMQVVDLMRHTSGLTYGFQNRTNVDSAYRRLHVGEVYGERDLKGFVDQLAELPLEFSPGTAWNYSVSTDVLGYLVQVVSGMAFEDFLETRIFEPLGMVDTGFSVRAGEEKRLTACYQALPGGRMKLQDDPEKSPYLAPPKLVSGGGGLVSTAADYARFCRMLSNRGELDGARLVAPKTLALMSANHLPGGADLTQMSVSLFSESTNAGVGFGLGFATVFEPARTLLPSSRGEFYWGGMASTAFWIDPVEDVAVVFMTQLMPSSSYPIRRELRTLVYSALMETNA
ncbi:serine hydrolase domain-containing protein [Phenylobacterium sp.]|uniref:serine hydrolase domain-containing protein n=1 Tax=Phenylobacterium sp. TaxID=1871053 RepID=UPI0035AEEDA7